MIAARLRALERFLLPNACVTCDRLVGTDEPDALLCGLCRSRARAVGHGCPRCQHPAPPVGPCRFCRSWPSILRCARSAVWLDETTRPAVHQLKYGGLARVAADIGLLIVRTLPRPPAGLLVPIPLSPRRERTRGYNQATALARALSNHWRLPVALGVLRRVRETASQTALAPDARARNVAGAFTAAVPPRHPASGSGMSPTIILVDDVLTTGATLVAGAIALRDAGWTTVEAVTFARALPYDLRVP